MKYNRINIIVVCLFMSTFNFNACDKNLDEDRFDVIADFAYPVSRVESIRHEIVQGLYFLRQTACESDDCMYVLEMLEQAYSSSIVRGEMTPDDHDFLQAMLDQINALIASLEAQNKH